MFKPVFKCVVMLMVALGCCVVASAEDKPYKEGAVTEVSWIRVKDGKLFDYMEHLKGTYRQEMEAFKKAGLILDYKIYQVPPRRPEDPNLILTVTYPNFAALDRTADYEAVTAKIEGSLKAADNSYGQRGSIREVLGTELIQELVLK